MQIVNVSDSATPSLMGSYGAPGSAWDVTIVGDMAYVANGWSGLQIINIADPGAPTFVGSYNTPYFANSVTVVDNLTYVADRNSGLQIIDVTNPAAPSLVGSVDIQGSIYSVYVKDSLAYVADINYGLRIFNVANPAAPSLMGQYAVGASYDVTVVGDLAYVANGASGLEIIDVSNPAAPSPVGSYDTPGTAESVVVVGNLVYVADDDGGLQIIDVSDPAAPRLIGSHDTPGYARGVTVSGDLAYVADDSYGNLQIIDISNPAAPSLLGTYDTPGRARNTALAGNLGCVADDYGGLRIFRNSAAVRSIAQMGPATYRLQFGNPLAAGDYTLAVGPQIADSSGLPMDQDRDDVLGEFPDDAFRMTWTSGTVMPPASGRPHTLTLAPGQTLTDVNFGNHALPVMIEGFKWNDFDGDGAWDQPDEPGLEGWTIYIDANENGQLDAGELSTVTAADGSYSFGPLEAGTYTVAEVLQAGWTQTCPDAASGGAYTLELAPGEFASDVNFGNWQPAYIEGFKWNDLDGDGVWDQPDEPGLEGWTIYVDANANGQLDAGELSTSTAADGSYAFNDLTAGTYLVREVLQTGWEQTYPGSDGTHTVELAPGDVVSDVDFGNWQYVEIRGFKWNDLNGDGHWDQPGEPSLEGWMIYVDENENGQLDAGELSTTTAADGSYAFNDLTPGTYLLGEVLQTGWEQTYPGSDGTHTVELAPGDVASEVNFGNWQPAYIEGFKWNDLDGDGQWDRPDEPGLEGWTIYVDANANGQLDAGELSTVTAADGSYSFGPLEAGTYTVAEVLQAGWTQTCPDAASGGAHTVELAPGEVASGVNFGNWQPAYIEGLKWNDLDGDGVWDQPDEPGLEGWTIYVDANANGQLDAGELSTSTAADGSYAFNDLPAGTYLVHEVLQTGWGQTYPGSDGTHTVELAPGEFVSDVDFGNWQPAYIEGFKWNDLDGDGVWDQPDEPGLEGWTIYVDANENGQLDNDELSTVTAADGNYTLGPLAPGSYAVREVLQPGWEQTSPGNIERVSVASDGTEANGVSGSYSQEPCSISADGRFVAFASAASNLVPDDTNGYSDIFVYDRQTDQIERVSVADDGTQGNGESGDYTTPSTSISADGRFVAFESHASNLVPNDTNGQRDVFLYDRLTGDIERVSVAADGTQASGSSTDPFVSADGRFVTFESSASNLVPGDNNNKTDVFVRDRQAGTVELVSVATDGTAANQSSYASSISSDGQIVVFQSYASTLVPNDTNGKYDIFAHNRSTGETTRVSVASDGTQSMIGNSLCASVSADGRFVAFDSTASDLVPGDTNSRYDAFVYDRQTGLIERVSVSAEGIEGNGDSENVSLSADGRFVTFWSAADNLVPDDQNGVEDAFVFDRVTRQIRRVSVACDGSEANAPSYIPALSADGHFIVFHSAASNLVPGDTNSTVDVFVLGNPLASPTANMVAVGPGEVLTDVNFGNHAPPNTIEGFKWYDGDGDGQWDQPDEPGLEGWTIYIDANANGQLDTGEQSTTTAADGSYSFGDLDAGTYSVAEVLKPGWSQTYPGDATGNTHSVELAPGGFFGGVNFGNQAGPSYIEGFKFNDLDGDGLWDQPDEPGLEGWTIYVDENGNGQLDTDELSTTTAADGSYTLGPLGPGTYAVAEVVWPGWAQTYPGAAGDNVHTVELAPGEVAADVNFGNRQTDVCVYGHIESGHDHLRASRQRVTRDGQWRRDSGRGCHRRDDALPRRPRQYGHVGAQRHRRHGSIRGWPHRLPLAVEHEHRRGGQQFRDDLRHRDRHERAGPTGFGHALRFQRQRRLQRFRELQHDDHRRRGELCRVRLRGGRGGRDRPDRRGVRRGLGWNRRGVSVRRHERRRLPFRPVEVGVGVLLRHLGRGNRLCPGLLRRHRRRREHGLLLRLVRRGHVPGLRDAKLDVGQRLLQCRPRHQLQHGGDRRDRHNRRGVWIGFRRPGQRVHVRFLRGRHVQRRPDQGEVGLRHRQHERRHRLPLCVRRDMDGPRRQPGHGLFVRLEQRGRVPRLRGLQLDGRSYLLQRRAGASVPCAAT